MYKMYILGVLLKNMKKKVILVNKDDKFPEGKCVFFIWKLLSCTICKLWYDGTQSQKEHIIKMSHNVLSNCLIYKKVFLSAKQEAVYPRRPSVLSSTIQRNNPSNQLQHFHILLLCIQESYRKCIHDSGHGWFVLELSFSALCICSAAGNPFKHVFAPCLAAGAFLQIHSVSLEEQVELRSLKHKVTMSDFCFCLVIQSGGFPMGPTRAAGVSKNRGFIWNAIMECF